MTTKKPARRRTKVVKEVKEEPMVKATTTVKKEGDVKPDVEIKEEVKVDVKEEPVPDKLEEQESEPEDLPPSKKADTITLAFHEERKLSKEATILRDIENKIKDAIASTDAEIMRCDDYIFADADANKFFYTYKKELHTYRYLMRQLRLDPRFPNVPESAFPIIPEYLEDI